MHLKNCVGLCSFKSNGKLFKRQAYCEWCMRGGPLRMFLVCTNEILPRGPEQPENPPVQGTKLDLMATEF